MTTTLETATEATTSTSAALTAADLMSPVDNVITDDAYGNGPVERLLTPLRGLVRPGNSGGPLLDSSGRVLTTVFAATVAGSSHGGYGVANASLGALLTAARARAAEGLTVSTEGCTSG